MTTTFRFLSGEQDDFILDMEIDARATFAQLHQAIQQKLNYDATQMASFFVTDHDWNKETEITLMDMGADGDMPSVSMEDAVIEDYIREPHQRFLYVFDLFSERCFFAEVIEMNHRECTKPQCIICIGDAPQQIVIDDSLDLEPDDYDQEDIYDDLDEYDDFDPEQGYYNDESDADFY